MEDYPAGFPKVAAFVDSDENFVFYRIFGWLSSRILLYNQDKLMELEEDLRKLDGCDARQDPHRLQNRQRDDARFDDARPRRRLLFEKIEPLLKQYRKCIDFLIKKRH